MRSRTAVNRVSIVKKHRRHRRHGQQKQSKNDSEPQPNENNDCKAMDSSITVEDVDSSSFLSTEETARRPSNISIIHVCHLDSQSTPNFKSQSLGQNCSVKNPASAAPSAKQSTNRTLSRAITSRSSKLNNSISDRKSIGPDFSLKYLTDSSKSFHSTSNVSWTTSKGPLIFRRDRRPYPVFSNDNEEKKKRKSKRRRRAGAWLECCPCCSPCCCLLTGLLLALILGAIAALIGVLISSNKTTKTSTTSTTSTTTTTATTSTTTSSTSTSATTSTTSTTSSSSTSSTTSSTSSTSTTSTSSSTSTSSTTSSTSSTSTTSSTSSTSTSSTSTSSTSTTSTSSTSTTSTATTSTSSTSTSSTSATSTTTVSTSTASRTTTSATTVTTKTTTTTASTNSITSNTCTSGWTGVTVLYHCTNCPDISAYTQFTYTYTAIATQTRISFSFWEDVGCFALDGVSVRSVLAPGVELIANNGFETDDMTSWIYCNPSGAPNAGQVYANSDNFQCMGVTYQSQSGNCFYYDGAVGNCDYVYQKFATNIGETYTISYWLFNLGSGSQSSADIMISV